MKVNIAHKGNVFAREIVVANTFWIKLSGYMFRRKPHVPGLLFDPCNSIQTTFMKFNLDLVFLTKNNEVVKIIRDIRPWRFTAFYFKARRTLELPAGKVPLDLSVGDTLEVVHV